MPPQADAPRGRPLRALLLYLLAVFVGGALLAPWPYYAVQALAGEQGTLAKLARMPFARYVNRALLITALVALPFFIRAAGIRRWADVGVAPVLVRWRRFAAGFGLGFVSLAIVCAVALVAGGRLPRARTPGRAVPRRAGAAAGPRATG